MQRKRYIDAVKGWGLLMVIFGHLTPRTCAADKVFSSYKVAIFFVVSGYLLAMREAENPREETLGAFALRHGKKLLLPFFLYSFLCLPYTALINIRRGRTGAEILRKLLSIGYKTLSLRGYSTLWFLPSLFLAQIFFLWAFRRNKGFQALFWVLAICVGVFAHAWLGGIQALWEGRFGGGSGYKFLTYPLLALLRAYFCSFFVVAGFTLYKPVRRLSERPRFLLGLACSAVPVLTYFFWRVPALDLNNMNLKNGPAQAVVCGVLGSLGAILVLEGLEKVLPLKLLTWVGRNSLTIMATHVIFNVKYLAYLGVDAFVKIPKRVGLVYYLDVSFAEGVTLLMEAGVIQLVEEARKAWGALAGRLWKRGDEG